MGCGISFADDGASEGKYQKKKKKRRPKVATLAAPENETTLEDYREILVEEEVIGDNEELPSHDSQMEEARSLSVVMSDPSFANYDVPYGVGGSRAASVSGSLNSFSPTAGGGRGWFPPSAQVQQQVLYDTGSTSSNVSSSMGSRRSIRSAMRGSRQASVCQSPGMGPITNLSPSSMPGTGSAFQKQPFLVLQWADALEDRAGGTPGGSGSPRDGGSEVTTPLQSDALNRSQLLRLASSGGTADDYTATTSLRQGYEDDQEGSQSMLLGVTETAWESALGGGSLKSTSQCDASQTNAQFPTSVPVPSPSRGMTSGVSGLQLQQDTREVSLPGGVPGSARSSSTTSQLSINSKPSFMMSPAPQPMAPGGVFVLAGEFPESEPLSLTNSGGVETGISPIPLLAVSHTPPTHSPVFGPAAPPPVGGGVGLRSPNLGGTISSNNGMNGAGRSLSASNTHNLLTIEEDWMELHEGTRSFNPSPMASFNNSLSGIPSHSLSNKRPQAGASPNPPALHPDSKAGSAMVCGSSVLSMPFVPGTE